jgi:hypothetical protein
MNRLRWFVSVVSLALTIAIFLAIGVLWSRISKNGDRGWLLVAVVVFQFAGIRRSEDKGPGLARIWGPFLAAAAIEILSDHSFGQLMRHPSRNYAMAYAGWSCVFFIYLTAWIVIFPCEERFGIDWSAGSGRWRGLVRIIAVVIAAGVLAGTIWELNSLGPTYAEASEILRIWFGRVALAVFVFLGLRILFPAALPETLPRVQRT